MQGSKIGKRRPVLIVSNNANNKAASSLTVVPLISNVEKVYPFEVFLAPENSGLPKPSKAQAQQIRTISKIGIVGQRCGKLDNALLQEIDEALRLHLGLS